MNLKHTQHRDKDPESVRWFGFDWSEWLDGDTIQTSTWSIPAGLTSVSQSNTATTAKVKISGGTAGQVYTITNHIITVGGDEDERSLYISVKQL